MELNLKNSLYAADFAGKVAIFDMDGVLMPFRYNGRVQPKDGAYHIEPEEFEAGIIEKSLPSKHLQDIISSIDTIECLAMTNTVYNGEYDQRMAWLNEHFTKIKDLLICQNGKTAVAAIEDRIHYNNNRGINVSKNDIIVVCSDVWRVNHLEVCGYDAWHVSSLMDFYKHN